MSFSKQRFHGDLLYSKFWPRHELGMSLSFDCRKMIQWIYFIGYWRGIYQWDNIGLVRTIIISLESSFPFLLFKSGCSVRFEMFLSMSVGNVFSWDDDSWRCFEILGFKVTESNLGVRNSSTSADTEDIPEVPWSTMQQFFTSIQCEAPKISKLVYNSNNYGLWYL